MTTHNPIRVGIVGASADGGWARFAHVPALQALPEFELAAVATTRRESAEKAAAAFGAKHAFADVAALAASPDIDLVVVSVKAPNHEAAVTAALQANKNVLCEWPFGASSEQAASMTALARGQGVVGGVGLQARATPQARYVRDLLEQGHIGRVLSVTAVGTHSHWGVNTSSAYSADKRSGANVLTIPGGHTLDLIGFLLGDPVSLSAEAPSQITEAFVADAGKSVPVDSPNQVAVCGTLASGVVLSLHLRGFVPKTNDIELRIAGTEGQLVLAGSGMAQTADLTITLGGRADQPQRLVVPDDYRMPALPAAGPAVNVAYAYRQLARDLRAGSRPATDFERGLQVHRILDAIRLAAESGRRVSV
jgi:predicted dehydrogenase